MKRFLLYIISLALVSCAKELPFPENQIEKKMVVNSFVTVGEPIRVRISETYTPSEDGNLTFLQNAIVKLLDSAGNVIEVLANDTATGYFASTVIAQPATLYLIEASETAKSYYCTSQSRTPRNKPSYTADTSTIYFQGKPHFFQISIRLSDIPNTDNYYLFYCTKTFYTYKKSNGNITDSTLHIEKMDLFTNDYWFVRNINTQFSKKELLLVDDEFKGLITNLKFGTFVEHKSPDKERIVSINLHVSSLSKERYIYTRSLNEYLFYQSDPFSQTTSVYSNIQGGYGIFATDFPETIEYYFK